MARENLGDVRGLSVRKTPSKTHLHKETPLHWGREAGKKPHTKENAVN